MPRKSLIALPFHESTPLNRKCPKCKVEKPTTNANWYARKTWRMVTILDSDTSDSMRSMGQGNDWEVRRQVLVPSTYCRACTNQMKIDERDLKKFLDALPPAELAKVQLMRQGPCGICHRRAKQQTLILYPVPAAVCLSCRQYLTAAMESPDPIAFAMECWRGLRQHLIDEERIKSEVLARTNRFTVPYHKYNPAVKGILAQNHIICISMEVSWRRALVWLKANVPFLP